jgi:hypothetical protein
MNEVIASVFYADDHAHEILAVVRGAGIDARLVRVDEMPRDRIPDWVDLNHVAYGSNRAASWFMVVPEEDRERAEIASHKHYGLCRWCGRRLAGKTSGVCPECGTVIDPYE